MLQLPRAFIVFLVSLFLAGTLAVPGAIIRAEAAAVMTAGDVMGEDCRDGRCDNARAAACDLLCALPAAIIPADPPAPFAAAATGHFVRADASAAEFAPSPALTPPRTNDLI